MNNFTDSTTHQAPVETEPQDGQLQNTQTEPNTHVEQTMTQTNQQHEITSLDLTSYIDPDPQLIEIVNNDIRFMQKGIYASPDQTLLLALAIEGSYFAKSSPVQTIIKVKVGDPGNNINDTTKILARQAYCPIIDEYLQSSVFKNHCKVHPYATCISAYQGKPAKAMRNKGELVHYGTHIIVHQGAVPYMHDKEGLLANISLPPVPDGLTLTKPESFTEEEEAELAINKAERALWHIQHKAKVLAKLTNCTLPKPEDVSDKVFNAFKLPLVLASRMGQEQLEMMYAMMQASNPLKNQLPKDTAMLVDIKVLTEQAKRRYSHEAGIASAMLVGQLASLSHGQWSDTVTAKSLCKFMKDFKVQPESIKHDFINTSGYKFDDLERLFAEKLDLSLPLQQKRYAELTAMLNQQHAA